MKKELWMNVSIVDFGNGKIEGRYYESVSDNEIATKELPLNKAKRLMWELVLAGGVRSVRVSRYDRHMVTSEAYIFLPI